MGQLQFKYIVADVHDPENPMKIIVASTGHGAAMAYVRGLEEHCRYAISVRLSSDPERKARIFDVRSELVAVER